MRSSVTWIAGIRLREKNQEEMSSRDRYTPGPAARAEVRKDGEHWTLIVVRELRHPPAQVWQALTDPKQLREWAPFDIPAIPILAI